MRQRAFGLGDLTRLAPVGHPHRRHKNAAPVTAARVGGAPELATGLRHGCHRYQSKSCHRGWAHLPTITCGCTTEPGKKGRPLLSETAQAPAHPCGWPNPHICGLRTCLCSVLVRPILARRLHDLPGHLCWLRICGRAPQGTTLQRQKSRTRMTDRNTRKNEFHTTGHKNRCGLDAEEGSPISAWPNSHEIGP